MSLLPDDESALFNALPTDGSSVSNPSLRQYLKWNRNRYFLARDGLVDKGLVLRGRGRGGVVRRSQPEPSADADQVAVVVQRGAPDAEMIEAAITNEPNLYEPMRKVIERDWAQEHRQDLLAVEITAFGGGRPDGIWTRPDITTVEVRTFEYVPGKHLDVNTFEIKSPSSVNVQAVYEALAHRRAATRSYVLFYIPPDKASVLKHDVERLLRQPACTASGLSPRANPCDYDTWEELEEAQRSAPDPEKLNDFISAQLSPATRSLISRRLR